MINIAAKHRKVKVFFANTFCNTNFEEQLFYRTSLVAASDRTSLVAASDRTVTKSKAIFIRRTKYQWSLNSPLYTLLNSLFALFPFNRKFGTFQFLYIWSSMTSLLYRNILPWRLLLDVYSLNIKNKLFCGKFRKLLFKADLSKCLNMKEKVSILPTRHST